MADEKTPQHGGNELDPSEVTPQVAPGETHEPLAASGEAPVVDPDVVAARARSARPVRRSASSAASRATADEAPAEQPRSGATAAPAPRPVRRARPVAEAPGSEVAASASRPVRRPSTDVAETPRRTTPALFVNQSVGELRKVIWPTAQQLRQYFMVVLLFVLFIVAYVGLLDGLFGWTMLKLFGK